MQDLSPEAIQFEARRLGRILGPRPQFDWDIASKEELAELRAWWSLAETLGEMLADSACSDTDLLADACGDVQPERCPPWKRVLWEAVRITTDCNGAPHPTPDEGARGAASTASSEDLDGDR